MLTSPLQIVCDSLRVLNSLMIMSNDQSNEFCHSMPMSNFQLPWVHWFDNGISIANRAHNPIEQVYFSVLISQQERWHYFHIGDYCFGVDIEINKVDQQKSELNKHRPRKDYFDQFFNTFAYLS